MIFFYPYFCSDSTKIRKLCHVDRLNLSFFRSIRPRNDSDCNEYYAFYRLVSSKTTARISVNGITIKIHRKIFLAQQTVPFLILHFQPLIRLNKKRIQNQKLKRLELHSDDCYLTLNRKILKKCYIKLISCEVTFLNIILNQSF